jgi:hypothetical protein
MTRIEPVAASDAELRDELDRHGILVVPQTVYEWRGYRYSNARDAIAAAERAAR